MYLQYFFSPYDSFLLAVRAPKHISDQVQEKQEQASDRNPAWGLLTEALVAQAWQPPLRLVGEENKTSKYTAIDLSPISIHLLLQLPDDVPQWHTGRGREGESPRPWLRSGPHYPVKWGRTRTAHITVDTVSRLGYGVLGICEAGTSIQR